MNSSCRFPGVPTVGWSGPGAAWAAHVLTLGSDGHLLCICVRLTDKLGLEIGIWAHGYKCGLSF